MRMKHGLKWLGISVLWLLICIGSCTDNPFFSDSSIDSNVILGRVTLDDGADPEGAYVWLKALDIGTRTDAGGRFSLTLPAPSHQPSGGLNGVWSVYCYVANYAVDSLEVVFFNGYPKEPDFEHRVKLHKILNIRAVFEPSNVKMSDLDSLIVRFFVRAADAPVKIEGSFCFPLWRDGPQFMAGFLSKRESEELILPYFYTSPLKGARSVVFEIRQNEIELHPFLFKNEFGIIPPGEYEAVPYLLIHQEDLPSGLLESIGPDAQDFCADFLNIPFTIRSNRTFISWN